MSSRMAIEDTPFCSVDVDLIPTACRSIRTWIRSQFRLCASIKVNCTASAIATTGEEQFSLVAKASSPILIWVVQRLASGCVVGSSASLFLPSKVAVELLVKSHHMLGLYSRSCVLAVECNTSTSTATNIEHH